jgi:hypothetical protein
MSDSLPDAQPFIRGHLNELSKTVAQFRDGAFWVMDWTPREHYPDKPPQEQVFDDERALGVMLIDGVIFLNAYWWEDTWPEKARKSISLNVNCNDVFAWACADGEHLPYSEIENLYRRHLKPKSRNLAEI